MSSGNPAPVIQVLEKDDYAKQHLVTLPADPLPPLGPSSLRLKSEILGLTTNNFSYARLGHLLGWWDIHPLPSNAPAPFNDTSKYGCISAWGYATIIASTVPTISVGKTMYGYLPIGTLPVDVQVQVSPIADSQIEVLDPHRQHLWKIYNRYSIHEPLSELLESPGPDFLAWDALMQALFGTSYNLNRYGFAWAAADLIHPSGNAGQAWTLKDADLQDAVVIVLSASGKTAVSFAHQVRRNRPQNQQPLAVLGVGSERSKSLIERTGWYDGAVLYSDDPTKVLKPYPTAKKIVIIDFGARAGAASSWRTALSPLSQPVQFMRVGAEVKPMTQEEATTHFSQIRARGEFVIHASDLREKGIERAGAKYFEQFYEAFDEFKREGGIPGVTIQWGKGMRDWARGWDDLVNDRVGPHTALVYRLDE